MFGLQLGQTVTNSSEEYTTYVSSNPSLCSIGQWDVWMNIKLV